MTPSTSFTRSPDESDWKCVLTLIVICNLIILVSSGIILGILGWGISKPCQSSELEQFDFLRGYFHGFQIGVFAVGIGVFLYNFFQFIGLMIDIVKSRVNNLKKRDPEGPQALLWITSGLVGLGLYDQSEDPVWAYVAFSIVLTGFAGNIFTSWCRKWLKFILSSDYGLQKSSMEKSSNNEGKQAI